MKRTFFAAVFALLAVTLLVPASEAKSPLLIAGSRAFTVKAGPIWNNNHAKRVCPRICAQRRSRWTGHWWTTVPGRMSVCQCRR